MAFNRNGEGWYWLGTNQEAIALCEGSTVRRADWEEAGWYYLDFTQQRCPRN